MFTNEWYYQNDRLIPIIHKATGMQNGVSKPLRYDFYSLLQNLVVLIYQIKMLLLINIWIFKDLN